MIGPGMLPEESHLLDQDMRKQISGVFSKLDREIWLISIVDKAQEKCMELASLLKDMERQGDKVHVEFYEPGEEPELDCELTPEGKLPVVGIYEKGRVYTGQSFLGVPGGKELNSLIISIYNTAGPGQALDENTLKRIRSWNTPVTIQIFVSLACHHCAQTVTACLRMAALNEHISAQMVDANLFPDYVQKYQIERVPMTVLNDKHKLIGGKSTEEVLDYMERTCLKLPE